MNLSISQIAREAGVSKMTISRVMNGHPHVSEKTRRKVEKIVTKRRYRVNPAARHLSRGTRFDMVAVVTGIDDLFQNGFFHGLIRSIETPLKQRGHAIALFNIERTHSAGSEDPTLEMLASNYAGRVIKGVVVLGPPVKDARIDFLADRGVRGLLVCSETNRAGFGSIGTDNAAGIEILVDHLVGYGHRRIGLLEGPRDLSDARERSAAFLAAMKRRGLPVRKEDIVPNGFTREGGRRAAETWLGSGVLPDAIIASNDAMAAGMYDAFARRGIRVPEQISLVGFDGTALAEQLDPPLTTIAQPLERMGEAVADAMVNETFDIQIRLPPTLVSGRSVARAKTA